jgi:hypothetical protein
MIYLQSDPCPIQTAVNISRRSSLSVDITYHATKRGDSSQKVDAAIRLDVAQDGSYIEFRHRDLQKWYAGMVGLLPRQVRLQFKREAKKTEQGELT